MRAWHRLTTTGMALLITSGVAASAQDAYSRFGQGADQFGGGQLGGDQLNFGGSGGLYQGEQLDTLTRHHRWGRETGIGSSNSQTTAATAGCMPAMNYRPTSASPALQPIRSMLPGAQPLFSNRMMNPALTPVTTTPPTFNLTGQINPRRYEGATMRPLSGEGYMLYGLGHSSLDNGAEQSPSLSGPSSLNLEKPGIP